MKNLKVKSVIIILLSTMALNFFDTIKGKAQEQPTFNAMVKNFELSDTLGGNDNVLFFDIYIQHTNLAASGPFEFSCKPVSF